MSFHHPPPGRLRPAPFARRRQPHGGGCFVSYLCPGFMLIGLFSFLFAFIFAFFLFSLVFISLCIFIFFILFCLFLYLLPSWYLFLQVSVQACFPALPVRQFLSSWRLCLPPPAPPVRGSRPLGAYARVAPTGVEEDMPAAFFLFSFFSFF